MSDYFYFFFIFFKGVWLGKTAVDYKLVLQPLLQV